MSATSNPIFLANEEATAQFAIGVAKRVQLGEVIFLYGEVGSGKTTFARAFIKELCDTSEEITSPTFSIVQNYAMKNGKELLHCDLYRLKNSHELLEIGIYDDIENRITLIEWPELIESEIPDALKISIDIDGDGRLVRIGG